MIALVLLIQDPYAIPFDRLDAEDAARAHAVMDRVGLTVDLPDTGVDSSLDVYEFCMAELPFTSQAAHALGKADYDMFRESDVTQERPVTDRMRRTFLLDDKAGMTVKIVPIFHESGRWIFYTYGRYDMDVLDVRSRAVIVVVAEPKDDKLLTRARIFMRIDDGLGAMAADLFEGSVRDIIRDKSTLFVDAAKTVTEAARRDPAKLSRLAEADERVDRGALEQFRKGFLTR